MTAQGGDILAWLETAIAVRAQEAQEACAGGEGRWHSGWCPEDKLEEGETSGAGVSDERDRTVVYDEGRPNKAQSVHIAANDPASVLRRCAADRKLLKLHGGNMHSCPATDETDYLDEWTHFDYSQACPVVELLADSYGWTAGTPPIEGDQMT
ncbi:MULTISPECIES: DUF6221 family protein [unclassified Streptomyces]|uniref:DUF6221 family protein n=1 Tax=unclassified Streptomyces TaxID=2593676 RepID=UPI0036E94FB7